MKEHGEIVFILGAGASQMAGAPLMGNFLDVAETLLANGVVTDEDAAHFRSVFDGLHRLQSVFAKSYIDAENLESVFAAFEMAELLGRLETGDKALSDSMRVLIVRTLEETIRIPVANRIVQTPEGYSAFAGQINRRVNSRGPKVTLITFNYDCALDWSLHREGLSIDYAIDDHERPPSENAVELLKLHGSMNWAGIPDGRFFAANVDSSMIYTADQEFSRLRASKNALARAHTRYGPDAEVRPVIVPPTGSKGEHHRRLRGVWHRAAERLSNAESIIISGYSLPITDEFFRYLFAIGTISRTRLKRVWVCDAHPSRELDERYKGLLGPMGKTRYLLSAMEFNKMGNSLDIENLTGLENVMKKYAFREAALRVKAT